ncbi:MAG TPA: VWA domain-containing protein [Acidobacteriota bacterium]|nr:VWA domain-containing protein [Acidobacteriota bacterium]
MKQFFRVQRSIVTTRLIKGKSKWAIVGVLLFLACSWGQVAADSDDVFEQSFEVGSNANIKVDNPAGTIAVEVWGEDLVHVVAARKGGGSQRVLQSEVSFWKGANQITIVCPAKLDAGPINLKIYIPRRTHLRLTSNQGDVEVLGPVASASIETQTGNVLIESPSSQDAEVIMRSTAGSVTCGVHMTVCDSSTPTLVEGKLGKGGSAIVIRSTSGNINLQPLRPQLAMLIAKGPNSDSQAGPLSDDQLSSKGSILRQRRDQAGSHPDQSGNYSGSSAPGSSDPYTPSSSGQTSGGGYTDVFGSNRDSQSSGSRTDQSGTQQRQGGGTTNTRGGLGVRIIPPPGSTQPQETTAADSVLDDLNSTDPATKGKRDDRSSSGGSAPNASSSPQGRTGGGYTDVFGSSSDTQSSGSRVDQSGTVQRRQGGGANNTQGGFGVRIIPPPGSTQPQSTTAADSVMDDLNSADPADSGSGGGSLSRRNKNRGTDDYLGSAPSPDTSRGSTGPNPPRIVRRGDDGSPDPTRKPVDDTASDEDTIKLDTKLVNLNVTVSNRSGRAITDLKQPDFVVFEDGVKQEVSHFIPVATPFNLVLLLDLSGSTREKIDSVKRSALRFVAATSPQDKVAVVAFTRGVQVVARPTNDRELLKKRIQEMQRTDGGTAFYEAMDFVMKDVLRGLQGERNAIVVMTDGVDNALSVAYPAPSRVSFKQMLDKILEFGTLVYPVYLDTESENYAQQWGESAEVYATARTQLQQIADASGGVLYMAPNVEDLGNIYEKIANELRTVYSIGYYPASFTKDGQWHKIQVKINRGEGVIRTRRGYYAK